MLYYQLHYNQKINQHIVYFMLIYFGEYISQNKYSTNANAKSTTVTVTQLQLLRKIS